MTICSNCQFKVVKEGAKFCPRCGSPLPVEKTEEASVIPATSLEGPKEGVFCPHCQKEIKPGQKFCTKCGRPIPTVTPFPPPEKIPAGSPIRREQNLDTSLPSGLVKPKTRLFFSVLIVVIILLLGGALAGAYYLGYLFDSEPPQVEITSPPKDKEIIIEPGKQAREIIEIAASDNRKVKKVELYVNGLLAKEFQKEPFLYQWQTENEGQYAFSAVAYDNKGNKGRSKTIIFNAIIMDIPVASGVSNVLGEIEQIKMTVYHHYENIPDNLSLAYSYFSSRFQSKVPFESWLKGFPNTISDTVENVKVTNLSNYEATAEINLTSKDNTGEGKILIRKWAGQWKLIKEWGEWKLDEPQIKKVAEFYE